MLAMGLVQQAPWLLVFINTAACTGPVAAATAIAVYVVLLSTHALLWRGRTRRAASTKDRREKEVRRIAAESKAPAAADASIARRPAEPTLAPAAARVILSRRRYGQAKPSPHRVRPRRVPSRVQRLQPAPPPSLSTLSGAATRGCPGPARRRRPATSISGPAAQPRAAGFDLPPFVTGRAGAQGNRKHRLAGQLQANGASVRGAAASSLTLRRRRPKPCRGGPREADVEVIQDRHQAPPRRS